MLKLIVVVDLRIPGLFCLKIRQLLSYQETLDQLQASYDTGRRKPISGAKIEKLGGIKCFIFFTFYSLIWF